MLRGDRDSQEHRRSFRSVFLENTEVAFCLLALPKVLLLLFCLANAAWLISQKW